MKNKLIVSFFRNFNNSNVIRLLLKTRMESGNLYGADDLYKMRQNRQRGFRTQHDRRNLHRA